jgi:hypothetical protein
VELFAQDPTATNAATAHLKPIHAMRDEKVCGLMMPVRTPATTTTGDVAATWEANTGRTADVVRIE